MKRLRCLPAAFALALLPASAPAQVPPNKVLPTFQVSKGLAISLWASEPLFVNPTCIDVDHRGRVWVCESVNYRDTLHGRPLRRPAGDRILILEHSKGTGRADKVTVFYQSPKILAPLGVAVAKDPVGPGWKVFVCQSPDILLFEDKDGDGKADGPPKKLLSGFGGIDHDHGVHGILIGPDGKLYFSVGDQGVHGLPGKGGKKWSSNAADCRAGTIWRCDLDGKNLELLAHNFRNEYEPCVDSFGTVFVSDNDDDGSQQTRICYVMPGGNYGYHPRGPGESHWHEEQPGVVPKILRTYFGSPTGMCVYEGTLLPKPYRGQLLHTDAGPRHVRCYHLTADGAGYGVDREDMVTSTDNWFRPSDICVAPDGSVYVADWYDPGVGGHGMGDTTRGRIFRIAPRGNRPSVPKVDLTSDRGLTEALASPALSVRYMAMARLQHMDRAKALAVLRPAARQRDNVWLRARALWQLARRAHRPEDIVRDFAPVLRDRDPNFRILAVRVFSDFTPAGSMPFADDGYRHLVGDPSAAVRREALLSLRHADPHKARPWILELATRYDGRDRIYLEAVGIAVGHHDKARRDVILKDFAKAFPVWDEKVANLIWELRPPGIAPLLEKRLADTALSAGQRARLVDIVAGSPDPAAGKVLLRTYLAGPPAEVRQRILANLKRYLPAKWQALRRSRDLADAVRRLLTRSETRADALTLVGAAGMTDAVGRVADIAKDPREATATRKAAVRTLARFKTAQATRALAMELVTAGPADLRVEAVHALGKQATPDALKALEHLVTAKADAAVKQAAVEALAGSRPGTIWLLAANDRKQLPGDLRADVGRLLRNSPFVDLRNRALLAFPPPGRMDPKKLPAIARLAARRGDLARGQRLLAGSAKSDLQCLKCHTIRGVGGNVGPDLSIIGKKASRENLFESILYPSKAIADQYVSWTVEKSDGTSVTGLLVEEKSSHLVLRDANATDHRIDKMDVESRTKSPISIMPDNLLAYMTEDDLVDMVEYLFSLKTPALTPDYWHIAGPFDNGAGDAGMEVVYPPEKKIDLRAVYRGKSGKVRWRTVRPGGQGYVDLQAFLAPDSNKVVSYLYRRVESPVDQEAEVLLGTDDCAKLWVNGRQVFTCRQHRAAAPDQDRVKVRLKKGKSTLLLKINNGDGGHGFYLTLLTGQELKAVVEK
jgi:putative membrane-bound dehydrogenase-like protein